MAELAEKYRDRAKERREGANPDYQAEDPITGASGYRAVAPDVKSGELSFQKTWYKQVGTYLTTICASYCGIM